MGNLLDAYDRDQLIGRIGRLEASSAARWGRMNVGEMVCHLKDPLLIALGEVPAADLSKFSTRTFLKWMVLAGVPAPKGKVKTFPEIDQAEGRGSRPTTLEADVETLLETVHQFVRHTADGGTFEASPVFGPMSTRQWGRLMWVHMHHHLKQFGV